MALLTINGLEKRYTTGREALRGVNMEIPAGKIVGLLGPNGSGKTTLLKTIAGLLQPDSGEIVYPGGARRGVESKTAVALLPDGMPMPGWMRVRDAFRYYEDLYPDYSKTRAGELMELLELDPQARVKQLSKGMQERLALALTFSREAALYLMDEPLGGIDPVGKMKVLESILSTDLGSSSILLSTHLVRDTEAIFDTILLLSQGQIVFQGDCEAIREESGKTVEQVYLEVFANAHTM